MLLEFDKRSVLTKPARSLWDSRDIIREELFGVERLEAHARSLAAAQAVDAQIAPVLPLANRLADNGATLLNAYLSISKSAETGGAITPAAEWLIDNYHLVEAQFLEVRSDLPPGYYKQLPKLSDGPFAGYPRVFGIAWAFVAHTDSLFDVEMLRRFIVAYQEVQVLTIGELWAASITLRIVLLENLRRLADLIVKSRQDRAAANALADRLLDVRLDPPELVSSVLADWDQAAVSPPFAVQLLRRLQDQDARIIPALTWLDQRLAAVGLTPDAVVADEHLRQGAATVTISNIINSLRMITSIDWADVFESVSPVDKVLSTDPAFFLVDFATRNLYRNAVEDLARGSGLAESDIAHRALSEAAAVQRGPEYVLAGGGRRAFEHSIAFHPKLIDRVKRSMRWFGIGGYAGSITVFTACFLSVAMAILSARGVEWPWLVALACLAAIPISESGVALANVLVVRLFGPSPLPALELKGPIPPELRTLVAVPVLLTSLKSVAEHVETLEVHDLASPDGEVYFALLSDWPDAQSQTMPDDAALLDAAIAGVAGLNARYPAGAAGPRFHLLHRPRSWSASEASWIGWERKRGKLHELNRLLRGASDTRFMSLRGVLPNPPQGIRYVITLDADTRLPRDTVRKLIGKMAHPLNAPRYDAGAGRIVAGYGVLQPRVTPSLPVGEAGSLFQRVFSAESGIDPYVAAVSDVYQDLCDEGSFAGKGIYDVDAFERALAGRVPEGSLLSHDLFEGVFARAGFVSDIEVIEEFPARYDSSAMRQHRWTRGDWQLLPWLLGKMPAGSGTDPQRSGIPLIGRWKMIDNLRRSLTAPLSVAALLAGWLLPFHAASVWTLMMLAIIMTPALITVLNGAAASRPGATLIGRLRSITTDFSFALTQSLFVVVLLADQAWLMADAIARTFYRLFVSRRNLLEWVSHAQTSVGAHSSLSKLARRMSGAIALGVLALVLAFVGDGTNWALALPFAALWIGSPALAYWSSLPPTVAGRPFAALWQAFPAVKRYASLSPLIEGQLPITATETTTLRLTARRTWRFFETFVTPNDNALPPDNFQEDPVAVLAHRTSPTNIGLYLLSAVSAHDFGWIGLGEALARIEVTLATLSRMERVRGHFYNWYDTQTLRPLDPRYISSVDSGNLAGHLIVLARAAREWRDRPSRHTPSIAGVRDAIDLGSAELHRMYPDDQQQQPEVISAFARSLDAFASKLVVNGGDASVGSPSLDELMIHARALADTVRGLPSTSKRSDHGDTVYWVDAARRTLESIQQDSDPTAASTLSIAERLTNIEAVARDMALAMEFGFLLDPQRKLLSIGYRVHEDELDANCYDLLASEARLASFVAIAKGDVPARHWFRLGRAVVLSARRAALISWSGSMFEYLMPSLAMRGPTGSLIEQTSRLIVRRQIDYGKSVGLPWGISESAYNVRDLELTYQYSNFGVPGLGLKRGLDANLVIAPYATALAAMVDPQAAVVNFEALATAGGLGRYGFYEALDYTPARLPVGETVAVVKAYMAHHHGMTIVAIANVLMDGRMRTRFHAEPLVQAAELLLQERPPRDVSVAEPLVSRTKTAARVRNFELPGGRKFTDASQATPATHLLSNGQYSVMLTSSGSGYSRWRDIAVTRWREDATADDWGSYHCLRDTATGTIWSAGLQPLGVEPDAMDITFNEDRAIFVRRDGALTTTLDVLVSGEDNAEVRHLTVTNDGDSERTIELTSYLELVLATQGADIAHPAFSKIFVQTDYLPELEALIATRRRRTSNEPEIWAAHLAVVTGQLVGPLQFETDRARFLGRNGCARKPAALLSERALSNSVGTVLDPVFALRHTVRIAPGGMARISYWTLVAATREALLDGIDKHRDGAAFTRAATLAWTQAQVQLHHIGIDPTTAALFQQLAGHLIYASPALRPSSDAILRGAGAQPGLWPLSISGDLPILLLRIADAEHLDLARQLLLAHEYCRMKTFSFDLVILNERSTSYVQDLQIDLEAMVRTSRSRRPASLAATAGGLFVVRADLMLPETRALLVSVARVVLVGQRGTLAEQLDRIPADPKRLPVRARRNAIHPPQAAPVIPKLEYFNGLGGFANDGRDYVVVLAPGRSTPAPWINVIANPTFGFQVSAEGAGFTWSAISRENQLTPWSNDPVRDRSGEVIFLRDEDTLETWSATAEPMRVAAATYVATHGRGYSRFEHSANEVAVTLEQFVPVADPVKISRLTLRNLSSRSRRISVTSYAEWVLGSSRSAAAAYVTTALDEATGALIARNPWSAGFASHVAFSDLGGRQSDWTADRREFIGRNGVLAAPLALATAAPLSGRVGAGLDPCAVLRTVIVLPPHAAVELRGLLGQAANIGEAQALIGKYRNADLTGVLADVEALWNEVLNRVHVTTPDRSMDIMLNGWLLYQTLACRVWARAAFYQASGAYGFRDQLQDGMALAGVRPDITRAHLLVAAGRQFIEGDVQHWWFPKTGMGTRSRITDDRAWLAFSAMHYADTSGDHAVFDQQVPFIEGQWLRDGEHDNLFTPMVSDRTATLYEHCAVALDASLALGPHGLPLIGTGDWNDGMNRVGEHGTGESVWLAWLHCASLTGFAAIAEARGQPERAVKWRAHVEALKAALDRDGWDGEWYRRGYYDDGTPLGSSSSEECQIDAIAQSWAVVSGAGDPARARSAMAAVERELILPDSQVNLLFKPPFDKTALEPGYIKGYPPGIRENGGQYTHGVLWSVVALAMLGDGDKAAELFALLNPINHARTEVEVNRYIVEPYVVAADVYAAPDHLGRGGWTWYTGSAGWMQRAGLEYILGFRVLAGALHLDPCIPKEWPGFDIRLKHGAARFDITIKNPNRVSRGIAQATLDGIAVAIRPLVIALADDGRTHRLEVTLG